MYARHQISEERSRVSSSSLVIEVVGLERIGIVLYLIINFVFILCISTKKTEGLDDIDRKRIKKNSFNYVKQEAETNNNLQQLNNNG